MELLKPERGLSYKFSGQKHLEQAIGRGISVIFWAESRGITIWRDTKRIHWATREGGKPPSQREIDRMIASSDDLAMTLSLVQAEIEFTNGVRKERRR